MIDRQAFKSLEQAYMVLADKYAELARALGDPGNAWYGDPTWTHEELLTKARQVSVSPDITKNDDTNTTHQGSQVHQSSTSNPA